MDLLRPQTHVFIATSLDGFIARPNGSLDWLTKAQGAAPAGEDFGYALFMSGIDALVMGRKTFETVLGFEPWPYEGKRVQVMTRQTGWQVPVHRQAQATVTHEAPGALLHRLGREGMGHVYLDGGELIQAFLREDLVDSITLTVIPLLLGSGRALWGPLHRDQSWQLLGVQHWPCGFAQLRYQRCA
jgi:dihydrofolate reductase